MNIKEYADLRAKLFAAIEKKTSWGKNELKIALDDVLLDWGAKNCSDAKIPNTNTK